MKIEVNFVGDLSDEQLNALAMSLYYSMVEYFNSDEGRAAWEEYQKQHNNNVA